MTMEQIGIMGIAVAANIIVIKWKFENDRTEDAALDLGLLILIGIVFQKTISGLMIGTIASALISIYLFFSPPKKLIDKIKKLKENFE